MAKHKGPFGKRMGFAFLDAVSLGRHRREHAEWEEAKRECAQYLDLNSEVEQFRRSQQDPEIYRYASYRVSAVAINRLENRRLIVVEQGFVGVTSAAARQGDLCASVNGLCSPLILRPISDKADHYSLAGNAYVVRGTRVVDGMVHTLRLDKNHKDWVEEHLPAKNLVLE